MSITAETHYFSFTTAKGAATEYKIINDSNHSLYVAPKDPDNNGDPVVHTFSTANINWVLDPVAGSPDLYKLKPSNAGKLLVHDSTIIFTKLGMEANEDWIITKEKDVDLGALVTLRRKSDSTTGWAGSQTEQDVKVKSVLGKFILATV